MKTTELNLTLAESELLEAGLDTFDKLMDYLEEHGSFEPIKGIGPITNKEILNAIEETFKAKPPVTVEVETKLPITPLTGTDEQESVLLEPSIPVIVPEEPIKEETPVEAPRAPESPPGPPVESRVEPQKTHALPANLTDMVCVTLIHARGNRSECSKMRQGEVDHFWSLNKQNWRSYEVCVCNC